MSDEVKPQDPGASSAGEPATEAKGTGTPAPQRRPDFFGNIYYGRDGVRSGWRLLIYLFLCAACAVVVFKVLGGGVDTDQVISPSRPVFGAIVNEGLLFLCLLVPALIMGQAEHRTLAQYGIPWRKAFGWNFWQGVLWGIAALTVLLLAIAALGDFSFGHPQLHGARIFFYAIAWALAFLAVGLCEEFLARGYTQFTLTTGLGFWPAAIITSIAFGIIHIDNPGESWIGVLAAGCIGFFFVFTLRRTGDLWFAIGFHCSWDWAEGYLYSVPNSGTRTPGHLLNSSLHGPRWLTGGSVGPEGSLLVFVVLAAMIALFHYTHRKAMYPLPDAPAAEPEPTTLGLPV